MARSAGLGLVASPGSIDGGWGAPSGAAAHSSCNGLRHIHGAKSPCGQIANTAYEVLRQIGSGSFGEVFLVRRIMPANVASRHGGAPMTCLGKSVAATEGEQMVMKEIPTFAAMEPSQREATEREVELLRAVGHPNIVAYKDSFVSNDGHLCIIMEYCEHGDLHAHLQEAKRTGQMPGEQRALEWFVQISLALHALHQRKILHRDLKTGNVFLTACRAQPSDPGVQHAGACKRYALKLGDLGIARMLDGTVELARTQIGTPFCMSPELFNNKPYGFKSDIWALGCVLYELISGRQAFEAQSINALVLKVVKGRFTALRDQDCNEETRFLIRSLLSTIPQHRPTLQEVLHVPVVRRHALAAVQVASATALGLEARHRAEELLGEQFAVLGLSHAVNPSRPTGNNVELPRRDRDLLLQRLERAERRKRREEETLRRLQETAALLHDYLGEATLLPDKQCHAAAPSLGNECDGPRAAGRVVPPIQKLQDRRELPQPLPLPLPQCADSTPLTARGAAAAGTAVAEDAPALSHRDRVLLRKEQRREEEQQRFEAEARKIREENLAFQRAWVQGSKAELGIAGQAQSKVLAAEPVHGHSSIYGQPMQYSPRRSRSCKSFESVAQPPPPPVSYAEPNPPNQTRQHKWNHWPGTSRANSSAWSSTGQVCLEPMQPHLPQDYYHYHMREQSDDSEHNQSGASDDDDGMSEYGGAFSEAGCGWGTDRSARSEWSGERVGMVNNRQLRRQSLVVQQRIEQCRAAIYRHKMTIETLQYSCKPETPTSRETLPNDRRPSFAHISSGTTSAPAVVQDSVAKLRRRCLDGLGSERFQAARKLLRDSLSLDAADVRGKMLEMLGYDRIGFYSLIDQIVHMEGKWGIQEIASCS